MFYIIMGVSGAGKSTIGKLLSDHTGWKFYDADDFHPQANIDKMNRGIPLTDGDRQSWLEELQHLIDHNLQENHQGILACSALKSDYRKILGQNNPNVVFIYLQGDYDCIQARIKQRQGHFMNADLLRSQFDTLEEPQNENTIVIDVSLEPDAIVEQILIQTSQSAIDN
ncbi:gluconokinase [Pleurocapsa sp. PCC 7319]|uniref:gluconokinase n=1 Tax=Pleurocapsa sp. PCC 7319 TaxID=118161 RepID=UPI00034C255D|nr:gluconokinase [Pleurocapsa sp. PCC 7319]